MVSSHLFSQQMDKQIAFRELSVAHGLSQNSVVSIAQDSTGYMWFATQDGLNKYDGRNFKTYPKQFEDVTRTTYSKLGKIYVDRHDGLWIITSSGKLEYFNKATDSFQPISISNDVSKIHQLPNGDFYIGTFGNGLYKIDKTLKDTIQLLKSSDKNLDIYDFNSYENTLFAATSKGVLKVTKGNYSIENVSDLEAINFSALELLQDETIFLGSFGKGLFTKSKTEKEFTQFKGFHEKPFPTDLIIQDLLIDKNKKLWVATYGQGVFLLDFKTQTIQHFLADKSNPYALHYNDVLSLYEDFTGTIWLGTDGAGLSYYDEHLAKFNVLTSHQVPHDIHVDVIRAISVVDTKIWLGTSGKGLTSVDVKSQQFKTITSENSNLSGDRIMSLLKDENGLWIGHQNQGLQYMDSHGKINTFEETKGFTIWKIYAMDSNRLWLCTRNNGLLLFNKKVGVEARYNTNNSILPTNNIRTVEYDHFSSLWIGTDQEGLFKLDINTGNIEPVSQIQDKIKSLYFGGNLLWVGTNGNGIKSYNPKTKAVQQLTMLEGLPNNVVYGILPEGKNGLWLSSNRGITKLDLSDFSFTNYENYDGLQAYEFNTGAYFKDANGTLYFGGLEGLNWFNPDQLSYNQVKPKTILAGLEVFSKPHPIKQNEAFSSNQNTMTFTFSGLHFSQPDRNHYKYQLIDHDKDWVYSGNRNTAHYTNLPPGDYTFKVISSNYDGMWNEEAASYSFTIKQPWYLSNWALFTYAFLLVFSGIGVYRYLKWRWHMKMQLEFEHQEMERLKKLDEFKTKLYNNISHEFRTPLTLISGPVEKQLSKQELSENDKEDLNLIKRNSKRLLNLVNQLLDLSKLETGNLKLSVSEGNLSLLLRQLATAFEFKAKEKGIRFTYDVPNINNAWFDKDVIEKVITNLLNNAIKYAPINGYVTFSVAVYDGNVILSVLNNGNNLNDDELPKLFQRYYQNNTQKEGVGIGLSLVKELTVLSHGNVVAHTLNKDDIQFTVTLPIEKDFFSTSEIVQKSYDVIVEEENKIEHQEVNGVSVNDLEEKPWLLIVEDDEDVRAFVTSVFKESYRIIEATNGESGIKKAAKHIPDIIISDIMMPKINGIQLCNTLKEDYRTSHIPIVLLTAKVGDQNEIEGLRTGADAYVTKPFNSEKLKIRVEKLIANRKKLQNYYGKSNALDFHNVQISNTEEQFIDKLKETVKETVLQPDFNAESLSKLMHMSRMQLHRKLKAITGLSTSEFIKTERLKLAVALLENSDHTVSEIAYQIGFNSPSYFIKSFKKIYSCTPMEYLSTIGK